MLEGLCCQFEMEHLLGILCHDIFTVEAGRDVWTGDMIQIQPLQDEQLERRLARNSRSEVFPESDKEGQD